MNATAIGQFGALARDITVQIVNCSASGCLLLADAPLPTGTTGSLRIVLHGTEASDVVQVVRCHRVEGAGTYHIGARFLWASPPRADSIRHVLPALAANSLAPAALRPRE